jgi:hypothetical protein
MMYHKKWKEFREGDQDLVKEERGRSRQRGVYKFLFMIGYTVDTGDKQRGLDDIATDIRALSHVTIVTIVVGNKNISERTYVAGISLKFIASNPAEFVSPEETKIKITREINKVRNVQRIYRVAPGLDRVE